MIRLLSAILIILTLAISCAETPTSAPETVFPSSTMKIAIAVPTKTPILTFTPTPTSALTPTSTPIPTPELPILSSWTGSVNLIIKPQFAWEKGNWNNLHLKGGILTITDDPDFGLQSMFMSTVTDNSVKPIRIYPDKAGPALKPSESGLCTTSIVVEMNKDYLKVPRDGFVNFLSVFSKAQGGFEGLGSILIDYTGNRSRIPSIYTNAAGVDFPPFDQVMFHKPLSPNTKYQMSLTFGNDGKLMGEIKVFNPDTKQFDPYDSTSASIDPKEKLQIESVHGGAYARGIPNGSWIKYSGIDAVCR